MRTVRGTAMPRCGHLCQDERSDIVSAEHWSLSDWHN
jgi:hypothetical protein